MNLQCVRRIHDIFVWIRIWICRSMPLTNGSWSGSCYFHHWPSRCQQKTVFKKSGSGSGRPKNIRIRPDPDPQYSKIMFLLICLDLTRRERTAPASTPSRRTTRSGRRSRPRSRSCTRRRTRRGARRRRRRPRGRGRWRNASGGSSRRGGRSWGSRPWRRISRPLTRKKVLYYF